MSPEDVARLEDEERQRKTAAGMNVAQQGRSPAEVASAHAIAQKLGLETALVESDPKPFSEQAKRDAADMMFDLHPWTVSHFANNPDDAAMTSTQDFPKLGNISSALGLSKPQGPIVNDFHFYGNLQKGMLALPQRKRAWTAQDYITKLPQAAVGAFGTAVTQTAQGILGVGEAITDAVGLDDELNDYYRQQEKVGNATLDNMRGDWADAGLAWHSDAVFSGVSSTIQMLLPLPFGKAAILPSLGLTTGGAAYTKYQGRGVGFGGSLLGAGLEGGIEYGTEKIPLGYLTGGKLGKEGIKSFLGKYVLSEVLGEQLATLGQDATEQAIAPQNGQTWADYWQQRPKAALDTLIATVTTSAMVGGGGAIMSRFGEQVDNTRLSAQAMQGQAILDQIMSNAEDAPLRKLSPEAFARTIDAGAKDSPVKNVFIPVEAIDKALEGELPEDERAALTFYQSQIDEARLSNGEVVIPIGEAAAKLAGTKVWQTLREDARVLAGGISGREATEHMDNLISELEKVGNEAFDEAKTLKPQIEAKAAVYEDVKAQVIAAGRSQREAQTTALLVASRAENLASERYGKFKDAKAAYDWMKLQIRGPAQAQPVKGKARKVGQSAFANPAKLLERSDWAVMTAENPGAVQLPPEENAMRMEELKQALTEMGLKYTEVRGKYGNEERSLAIEGISEEQARDLGARFGQESVLTHRGLVYGDETVNPAKGINLLDKDAEDFFTELPGGQKFSVDIDFDSRIPLRPVLKFGQADLSELDRVASAIGALEVANSRKFNTNRDFKQALQDMVKASAKGKLRDRVRLTRLALADARMALQQSRNAIGWYDEKLQTAMAVLGELHPEIETDENARFAFIYALAVTSTGMEVSSNFRLANEAYREYRRTGQMPQMGEGNGAAAMKIAFKLFNKFTGDMGVEGLRDFMTQEHTVGEIEKKLGVPVNGENKGTKVTGAAFLGPKIGNGYFSNLYGNYNQLTMDRWFMRTWGRWTGSLIINRPEAIKAQRAKVLGVMRSLTTAQKKQVNQLLSTQREPFKMTLSDVDGFARQVTLRTVKADVRAGLAAIHPRLRLDPKSLYIMLDGQKEAPQSAAERNEIRALMTPVLVELQRDNPELTMADLQAVLWYPEKRLYDAAKEVPNKAFQLDLFSAAKPQLEYNNDEAPDYANAAVALARKEGVAEEKINAAVEKARGRVAATQRARRAGRSPERSGAGERTRVPEDGRGFPLEDILVASGEDPMVLAQFGGEAGSFADPKVMTARYIAEDMEAAQLDPQTIWAHTGWMRGYDGKWRFEISDDEAYMVQRLNPSPVDAGDLQPEGMGGPYMRVEGEILEGEMLGNLLKHPNLFKHYPSLKDVKVYSSNSLPVRELGFFSERNNAIILNHASGEQENLSTLLHEIQHVIQTIEGFANGATTTREYLRGLGLEDVLDAQIEHNNAINRGEVPGWSFGQFLTPDQIERTAAFQVYERVAGEVEARNTQARTFLGDQERRQTFPDVTADVSREHVLLPVEQHEMAIAAASQTGPEGPTQNRGEAQFFPDGRTIIQLFKADFSTMLHELSHVFLQQEFTLAKDAKASPELKADIEKLGKWFADNGQPLGKNGMPPEGAHELFARTGERYFREGKAPSAELRGAFKQLKDWLTGIYKSMQALLAYGPAPINPEIREIMDRMLATDEAIRANATTPMSQEELGMTTAEYEAYLASVDTARDAAHDQLLERMMKAIKRREQSRYRDHRAIVRAEISEEVKSDPRFIALHLLRTGRWLNEPGREALQVKLNTGWLIDNYGEDVLKRLPVGLQAIHRGDGMVGDVVAEMVGMKSGDALVRALLDLKENADKLKAEGNPRPLMNQIIEDRTDSEMAKRYGDIAMSESDIEEEAIAALNSARQGEVLATELRQLKKQNPGTGIVTPYQLLREWARRKVNEGSVVDAVSKAALQRYVRGYNKARNAFEDAILKGDKNEAIKQKQAQMINHALLAEGKKVADEINNVVRRMQRYAKTKATAAIDQDYMDRIHELLEGYNFRPVSDASRAEKASFEEWAAAQRALGQEVHVPARFRDDRTNWKDAQVAKLLELNDMVQSLVELGKLKQRLTTAKDERERQEILDDAESRILNLPERKLPQASTGQENRPLRFYISKAATWADWREGVKRLFSPGRKAREIASGLIKFEGLADILDGTKDGTGPLNRTLIRPATDAANTFSSLTEEIMAPIIARYKNMSGKQAARLHDFVTIPELTLNVSIHEADTEHLGKPITIPRMKLLGLILNTGNLSNLSKLVGGEKWGDPESATELAHVRDVLVSYASKEDMDLVQDIWDGVAKLWPHIVRVEREMSGIVPEAVVPMEFDTPHGRYSGGYWPVVWDSSRSEMGKKQGEAAEASLEGVGFGLGTPKGHTITRTGAVAPIEWSLETVLFGHLNKVISRVAYAPWVRDALKIVDNPRIKGAIRLRMGEEYLKTIKPWIRDQIPSNHADIPGAISWEKYLNGARINMSIAVLGVSYTTGIAQELGLSYSAGTIGEGNVAAGAYWVGRGLAEMIKLEKNGLSGAQEFVFARSEEMRRRVHEVNQESAEVFRRLKDHDSLYRRAQAAAFWHIGFIDLNMVSIPTWLGAYHKALSEGLSEEEASAYADKNVRLSQGGGRKKDLAAIQRGNAGQKFIAMFYTPSSVFFNQQWEAAQHLKAGNWSKALAPTFWFLVVTTLAEAMMGGDWPDDPDDDGIGGMDITKWVARNLLFGMFYGIPVARDAANAMERKIRGEYAEYGNTPISMAASMIEKGAKSTYKQIKGEPTEGRDLKNQVAALGFLFGLPGNQIGKTSGFIKDVRDGKVQPHGVGDWFEGLAYGKLDK